MLVRKFTLALTACALILGFNSCKKSVDPEELEAVVGDLFPLTVGHKITFNGYMRDKTTNTNVDSTNAYYEARMTVVSNAAPTPVGGTSHLISDSSKVHPAPVWVASGFYVKRATSTSGDFQFLTNIGLFLRTFGVTHGGTASDTLKWVLLVKEGQRINDLPWEAYDSTFTGASGQVRLRVEGQFVGKEQLSLGGQSFTAYKLVATRKIFLGGSQTAAVSQQTAALWLQPGLGIVKFIFDSDGETPGFERNYLSRNW